MGMYNDAKNQPIYAQNIFSNTSSFIDITGEHGSDFIIQKWTKAL